MHVKARTETSHQNTHFVLMSCTSRRSCITGRCTRQAPNMTMLIRVPVAISAPIRVPICCISSIQSALLLIIRVQAHDRAAMELLHPAALSNAHSLLQVAAVDRAVHCEEQGTRPSVAAAIPINTASLAAHHSHIPRIIGSITMWRHITPVILPVIKCDCRDLPWKLMTHARGKVMNGHHEARRATNTPHHQSFSRRRWPGCRTSPSTLKYLPAAQTTTIHDSR